jgi:microcystin degradation protein MlrC
LVRIFSAAVGTETNTFSPLPTGWTTYRETLFHRQGATDLPDINFFVMPLKVWRKLAESNGDEFVESLAAHAQPGGFTVHSVWEQLRDAILEDIAAAGALDIVLLNLHGAMASTRCDDCEGDLLERARAITGPKTVIGVELDLHCHLTDRMLASANAIVLYKEYPHIDVEERAAELYRICRDAAAGKTHPVMALRDCRILGVWRTTDPPVRTLVDRMKAVERGDRVLSVSFCHGFPWANLPDVGAKTLAVTDGDVGLARALADDLGSEIWKLATIYKPSFVPLDEVIAAIRAGSPGLTVVADVSDNAGGGAASDSTFILTALLESGIRNVILGAIWDPVSVRLCQEAGEGELLHLRIGGKISPMSGNPIDLVVRVERIVENASVSFGAGRQSMGEAALISSNGLHIVVNSVRTQIFHPDAFTQFGVDLAAYDVVVVKSAQHFHAAFAPLATRILYAVTPGTVSPDFARIPLPRAGRPLSPQVVDPFAMEDTSPFRATDAT